MALNFLDRRSRWQRLRWQMFWGLVAAALPLALRSLLTASSSVADEFGGSLTAFLGGFIAILAGILLIRSLDRYPGVERAAAIVPSFTAAFGALLFVLLMLRLDYSRSSLIGSYLFAVGIFYYGFGRMMQRRRLRIAVVPQDKAHAVPLSTAAVHWIILSDPFEKIIDIDAVAADLRADLPDDWDRAIADFALAGVPVYHMKHLVESLTGRVELEHLSETIHGTLSPPRSYMFVKHAIDRLAALIFVIVMAPVLLAIALAIRIDSPGPSLFTQQRVGQNGRTFTLYKFRSMRADAADAVEPDERLAAMTQRDDDRITRLGRFLRRTRLDELPQAFNILAGQMSWIGPRPEAVPLSHWYGAEIAFYRYRHIVRPGITGWAQVLQGHVFDVEEVQGKLYFDFYYIKNYSLWLDILIVIRTIGIMISGFGAR